MTSSSQTQPRTSPAQDGRCRTFAAGAIPAAAESAVAEFTAAEFTAAAGGGAREPLPAVDPSMAFGCVDWFQYPDAEPRAAARA